MVVPTQPSSLAVARRGNGPGRRGLALPSAMFALVAIAVLLGGIFVFADLNAKSVRNRTQAARAVHVAEAGINHALALLRGSLKSQSFTRILRGSNNAIASAADQADDSVFVGWGLAGGDQIPHPAGQAFQGHTYVVTVADDPADTDGNPKADMNGRVRIWCRGTTNDGATATVEAIVGAVPMPGIAADGALGFNGANVAISGACGGAHANGNLTASGGGPTISTQATATGAVGGNWNLPGGAPAPELGAQPEVVIPDLNPMDYCATADYRLGLLGGVPSVQNVATSVWSAVATVGWTYTPASNTWNLAGGGGQPGTYCVTGNVSISGNNGAAGAPMSLSVLATGSIALAGTPYLAPDHEDGILMMAAGDISLGGTLGTGYSGLVYAGAQCLAQGSATLSGQLLCANGAQPVGATELIAAHTVQGSFRVNFDCSGNVFNKRRVLYWYPRIGV